jgi:hypothetical protein
LARSRVGVARRLAVIAVSLLALTASSPSSATVRAATPFVAVRGNHLVNGAGKDVRLLGVDRSGSEYECLTGKGVFDGPTGPGSITAMLSWHINAVRVPLNEDCWLGINGVPAGVSGTAYRVAIADYVARLQSYGLTVILDLHWAAPGDFVASGEWPMADADHAQAFWRSVALTFVSNHGVIFDLYNEPFVTSWLCWLHGCTARHRVSGTLVTYTTVGMQRLIDVVRSTGATQPLLVGGINFSTDDSQWLKYEPQDPDHQLVASFHTYNYAGCHFLRCWDGTLAPLATHVPIVVGELGENGCADTFISQFMPWADAHGISYLGWAWDSTGPPTDWSCGGKRALIRNYLGNATTYGVGLEDHLAGLAASSAGAS